MVQKFEHIVKEWERKWCRLSLENAFPPGRRFTLVLGGERIPRRIVDKQGRIWVGSSIQKLEVKRKYVVTVNDAFDEVSLTPA